MKKQAARRASSSNRRRPTTDDWRPARRPAQGRPEPRRGTTTDHRQPTIRASRRDVSARTDEPGEESAGTGIRLQKILSAAGVASRRASEQMIIEGRVTVNGAVVRTLGSKANPASDDIRVDGRRVKTDVRQRYIVLYKQIGRAHV